MSTRNPSGWSWFLGPYANHYRELGGPIRETIRSAQDTLCRLYLGLKGQESRGYRDKALQAVAHVHPVGPPQTLGELCLELAQENVLWAIKRSSPAWWEHPSTGGRKLRRDIQDLRRLLYRRNTEAGTT